LNSQTQGVLILSIAVVGLAGTALIIIGAQNCGGYIVDYCSGTVKTVTLSSANLYDGTTAVSSANASSLLMSFNNPGSETYITSLSIWQATTTVTYPNSTSVITKIYPENNVTITSWQDSTDSTGQINFSVHSNATELLSGKVTSFSFYPRTVSQINITADETWNFVVDFANGQSVSGSLLSE
jgi:hypothetical protein